LGCLRSVHYNLLAVRKLTGQKTSTAPRRSMKRSSIPLMTRKERTPRTRV
jgi:hypothetical protein